MNTHAQVVEALGQDQWRALQSSGLPLMVTNELLSIWLEGWPDRFANLVSEGTLLPMLNSLASALRRANTLAGDPEMTHIGLAEKLEIAELPLVLSNDGPRPVHHAQRGRRDEGDLEWNSR